MGNCVDTYVERDDGWDMIHVPISGDVRLMGPPLYGYTHFDHLYTERQLLAIMTFSDLVTEARERIFRDAVAIGYCDEDFTLDSGGSGTRAYAEAVSLYLGFMLGKIIDLGNNLCRWEPVAQCPRHLFGRQSILMTWDFAEANVFGNSSGSLKVIIDGFANAYDKSFGCELPKSLAFALQGDSQNQRVSMEKFVSTDPPYYDNIAFADLSDFFYVWLRRSLRTVFPSLFATDVSPKDEELIAAPYRHGGKRQAEAFFRDGMSQFVRNLATLVHPSAPITIYYAYKRSEFKDESASSSGWETFLQALISSGFMVTATWPIRCESRSRLNALQTNSLSSAIVFVCRKRPKDAEVITRHQFIRLLAEVLPRAIDQLTSLREDVLQ